MERQVGRKTRKKKPLILIFFPTFLMFMLSCDRHIEMFVGISAGNSD